MIKGKRTHEIKRIQNIGGIRYRRKQMTNLKRVAQDRCASETAKGHYCRIKEYKHAGFRYHVFVSDKKRKGWRYF